MPELLFKPGTCSTCPFKVREPTGELTCHGGPPHGHPVVSVDVKTKQINVITTITVFGTVEPDWWCAVHPQVRMNMIARGQG